MSDSEDRILYVGQSGNLRARLAQYKNVRRGHAPRKVVRLVQEARRICWELCPSRTAAILRENELLRTHRPKFNRLNVYPQAYGFICCRETSMGFELEWAREAAGDADTYGAFRSVRFVFTSLLRAVWRGLRGQTPLHAIPFPLAASGCRKFHFVTREPALFNATLRHVRNFLSGASDNLLESMPEKDLFQDRLAEWDREQLRAFFGVTRRTGIMRAFAGTGKPHRWLAKDKIDDLQVLTPR